MSDEYVPRPPADPEFRHSIVHTVDWETGYTDDVFCEWCGGEAWDLHDRQHPDTKVAACYQVLRGDIA